MSSATSTTGCTSFKGNASSTVKGVHRPGEATPSSKAGDSQGKGEPNKESTLKSLWRGITGDLAEMYLTRWATYNVLLLLISTDRHFFSNIFPEPQPPDSQNNIIYIQYRLILLLSSLSLLHILFLHGVAIRLLICVEKGMARAQGKGESTGEGTSSKVDSALQGSFRASLVMPTASPKQNPCEIAAE